MTFAKGAGLASSAVTDGEAQDVSAGELTRLRKPLPPKIQGRPSPVYIIALQARSGVDPVRSLRGALKTLWRRFGLRCIAIEEKAR